MPGSTSLRHLKDVCLIQVPVKTSLCRAKLVSLTQVPISTSLRRLKLVYFIYAPMRHHKDVSNRSDEFMYQLRRHGDVSAWSGEFKLVTKMDKFLLRTISVNFLGVSGGSVFLRQHLVRHWYVSQTQVLVVTLLRRPKLVGFIYVPVRRRKDVSNKSVSLTYQLRRRHDVLAWSATSRPL